MLAIYIIIYYIVLMTFLSLLTILFIGLKLGGIIAWSWWFVLLPLWIVPVVFLSFIVLSIILRNLFR